MWNVKRSEVFYITLIESEELSTGWKVVIHDVEHFALDSRPQTGQDNRICAVVNVGERNSIASPKMKKHPEGVDSDTSRDLLLPWSIDRPRPHNDIGNTVPLAVRNHQLVLLHLGVTIGIRYLYRFPFYRA